MHLGMLLEMAADGMADRVALGPLASGLTFAELASRARRLGAALEARPGERVGLIDLNSPAVPLTLFGSAIAGKPFVPINYRLADPQLRAIVARTAPATIIVGEGVVERVGPVDGVEFLSRAEALALAEDPEGKEKDGWGGDADEIAVLLFTSGTTGEPKAAVLRHSNLTEYIISTVEFAGSAEDEAAIVSVPPYHIAGISAVLSSTYSGRRVVQLEAFDPVAWVHIVRQESITHAMVVPTMLGRILDIVEKDGKGLPSLRSLSYGGGPMPLPVIERAVGLLPNVGFVNAYGLTETSSTIAVLGPDDHQAAFASDDPAVRARLASVGKPLPTLEVSIRDAAGVEVPTGERGEISVRGGQVSGEYLGRGTTLDSDGWFPTRDEGHLDEAGYLFVHGRLDDVIVRGGENLSPGEIEAVLLEHPSVLEAAVVGIPNKEWGEQVVAAVVTSGGVTEEDLKAHVRSRLRSSRTPDHIQFREELPFNESGKLLRRVLRTELSEAFT
ncbi:acyl-CoA synthetase (AMP-forming)/AMP-acid ligase II [Frankia torreyi]|uniref:Acyl-CoA synthetase (AMP-forming)/AMP-acid ligase II n=1 Tax=Frankia torreyi TaxID=1856 RepID=A0A0D8BNC9_9ACTN|nr:MULTISPECIES: AMP-binding protein [Frankia]KJE25514.1 acyl-CoA synthetase (AMP-forming)/AMP-acid ligase II [Frankia torreyi]KQM06158.1 acyl-CoA synthetase (AMP-forming)/AMP-acid ligase II [Frankia sp. CpI1-P]